MNLLDVRSRLGDRLTLSIEEAGEIFWDLRRSSAYEAARRGEIPTLKIGRRSVVPVARVAEMLGLDPAYLFSTPGADGVNPQVTNGAEPPNRPDESPIRHDDSPEPIRTDTTEWRR